jgi:hypothetical protein
VLLHALGAPFRLSDFKFFLSKAVPTDDPALRVRPTQITLESRPLSAEHVMLPLLLPDGL